MPLKDPEARRAYWKVYHLEHAEANRKRANDWYRAHKNDPGFRERRDAYNERWKAENRERHLAAVRRRKRAARATPEGAAKARAAYNRGWLRRKAVLTEIVLEAKALGCGECGESDATCLDFHHREPGAKSFTIGKALQRNVQPERLRDEIAKCDVLCSNCHLKHEAAQRSGWRYQTPSESPRDASRRAEKEARWLPLLDRARAMGCTTCAETDPVCLMFHHVNPKRKHFMVTAFRSRALRGPIVEEMLKCVVLCSNCHRRVHNGGLTLPRLNLAAYWRERLAY